MKKSVRVTWCTDSKLTLLFMPLVMLVNLKEFTRYSLSIRVAASNPVAVKPRKKPASPLIVTY